MENLVRDTTLEKMVDCLLGTAATVSAPLFAGYGLLESMKEPVPDRVIVATAAMVGGYYLLKVGDYFFNHKNPSVTF